MILGVLVVFNLEGFEVLLLLIEVLNLLFLMLGLGVSLSFIFPSFHHCCRYKDTIIFILNMLRK